MKKWQPTAANTVLIIAAAIAVAALMFVLYTAGVLGAALLLCGAIAFYFTPALFAYRFKHHNADAILILNFALGWTVLGWIAALIWAFMKPPSHAADQIRLAR